MIRSIEWWPRQSIREKIRGQNYFLPPGTPVDNFNFPTDDHGNHPAYFGRKKGSERLCRNPLDAS